MLTTSARHEAVIVRMAAVAAESSSMDQRIDELDTRIDKQWLEFYEVLQARQPVVKRGAGKNGAVYLSKD
jgi:phosphate uptake regulator